MEDLPILYLRKTTEAVVDGIQIFSFRIFRSINEFGRYSYGSSSVSSRRSRPMDLLLVLFFEASFDKTCHAIVVSIWQSGNNSKVEHIFLLFSRDLSSRLYVHPTD